MSGDPQSFYEGMNTQRTYRSVREAGTGFEKLARRPFAFLSLIVFVAIFATTGLRLLTGVMDSSSRLTTTSLLLILLLAHFIFLVTYQGIPRGVYDAIPAVLTVLLILACFFWGDGQLPGVAHGIALVAMYRFTTSLGTYVVESYVRARPGLARFTRTRIQQQWNSRWENKLFVENFALVITCYCVGTFLTHHIAKAATIRPLQAGLGTIVFTLVMTLLGARQLVRWQHKYRKSRKEMWNAVLAFWTVICSALTRSPDPFRPQRIREEHVGTWFFGEHPIGLLLCLFVVASVPSGGYFPVTFLSQEVVGTMAEVNSVQLASESEEEEISETVKRRVAIGQFRRKVNREPEEWLLFVPVSLVSNPAITALTLVLSVALSLYVPLLLCSAMTFSLIGTLVMELHTLDEQVFPTKRVQN